MELTNARCCWPVPAWLTLTAVGGFSPLVSILGVAGLTGALVLGYAAITALTWASESRGKFIFTQAAKSDSVLILVGGTKMAPSLALFCVG
jgi:hypothetical protein